jgi:orotate phosphoribosyltransferase
MQSHQQLFIETAIAAEALCFGEFTLKSGRISPYFFNAGKLYQGSSLSKLAKAYASTLVASGLEFDVVFGPAYKGISLAALTVAALFDEHGIDVPFAYNRKEKKEHGEGGQLVGAALKGQRVLIIDDVITAGTAIREVVQLLDNEQATLAGVLIGLNRQERGQATLSAVQEVEKDYKTRVCSIINLDNIVDYLSHADDQSLTDQVKAYRKQYGVEVV